MTTTAATQVGNLSVDYQTNPRVNETNVSDGTNHRRTTVDYSVAAYAQYGLPYFVSEYEADGTTEIRRTYTDYNLDQVFLNHRIIGLVSERKAKDMQTNQWVAKVTYDYDSFSLNSQATTAVSHDQSYDATATVRGNLTAVSRWDVNNITTVSTTISMHYDAAGNLLSTIDPAGHVTAIEYTDSFSDNADHNAFAYPTKIKDADWNASTAPNNYSTIQYNFDFAAKTRLQGPPPQSQSQGIIQTLTYDNAIRVKQITTANTGAYVHYEYGPDYISTFASVNDVATNYWQSDSYTNQFFDGLGRVFAVASNHPGSTGGNKTQYTRYDQMGRAVQQTNPFEIDSGWNPAGDDAAGYQFNVANTFDWKGRPLRTYNMDGTYKTFEYAGCGCAGGEKITLTDEVERQQVIYSDVLGRQWKTEVLNTNGIVYSTTTNTLNARDQVTLVRQTDSATGAYQDTTMGYDGYGSLTSKHVPEQKAGTATTYAYNDDNTIHSITDARGAAATYGYNNRHLVTSISYSAPTGITATPNVGFGYDAGGNRTSMSDGFGTKTYSYNQLSQLMSETRSFSDPNNSRINGVSATLSYDYNLAGQLKKITDATGMTISYGHDSIGRLNGVTGSDNLYAGVSNYAGSFQYRAWGGLKAMTVGTNHVSSLTYNLNLSLRHSTSVAAWCIRTTITGMMGASALCITPRTRVSIVLTSTIMRRD